MIIKGALYVIEPSTRNDKIWPTREEAAAPSVPKNILLTFESKTDTASFFPIYYRYSFHNCTVQDHF